MAKDNNVGDDLRYYLYTHVLQEIKVLAYHSNSLIIHQLKAKKITIVKEV